MEQVAALMLLVGCSGDYATCEQQPIPTPVYASVAECNSQIPVQMRLSGSAETRMLGACKAVEPNVLSQSGEVDWSVSRQGQLVVNIDAEPQRLALR